MDIYALGRTPREADRLYRKQVERAWQLMVERGLKADVQVRDVIRDSWARCLEIGVEPVTQRPRDRGTALAALREANAELLQASENTWRVLGDILSQSQSCLLVADAVLVGVALRNLFLAAMGEPPFVSGTFAAVATPVVVASLAAGLVALLGSTIWHRLVRDKGQAATWCKSLLREV